MCSQIDPLPSSSPQTEPPPPVETEQAVSEPDALEDLEEKSDEGLDPREVYFNIEYSVHVPDKTDKIIFVSTIPGNYSKRQKVLDIQYSPRPSRIFTRGQNKYAEFMIEEPLLDFTINIASRMILYDYDLVSATSTRNNKPEGDLDEYLNEEKYLDIDDPVIADNPLVNTLTEHPLDKIRMLYDYVLDNMSYDTYNPHSLGAAEALKTGKGDCTEYTDALVALSRASGFPARFVEGYYLFGSDLNNGHNWAEVYLNRYGWVPFDPTIDDSNKISGYTTFNNLQNTYVYLSFKRNDPALSYYHFYYYRYWGYNIEVTKNISYTLTP
ncbi:MAG: transglutaminase-like domain-containing protein [Actinomycetia bacterium]|nr:transglutaminase-like domain-containing protein [Actinomycetes bacterium]